MGDNIKVAVRLRNLIERETQSKATIHWKAKDKKTVCPVTSNSTAYSYDRVFAGHENNEVVYSEFCAPIVESVIKGFNGTIFAYGQTSSGKTYTLMGDEKFDLGIAHYTVRDLFERIQSIEDHEFLLRMSFMEIYNEKVMDLLAKKSEENLKLQNDLYGNVKVFNLTESEVQEPDQILELLRKSLRRRKTGETVMNQRSSRSHLIFRMIVESRLRGNENAAVKVSHFDIVDLAGSEKPSENTNNSTFRESVNINTSLLMLSQVINQLSNDKESEFIKYRASKLTRILKNSLGGNALTAIICTITPASQDETLSTLKFALSAKKIKNKPQVNEIETEETLIKSYANKIKLLTKQLETTKEEKDQEAKRRKDMQEQIESLKKKFVQFVPQNNITRNARRETWGGCLDLERMKSRFQQSRPRKLGALDEESERTLDFSEIDNTFKGDYFRNRISTVSSIDSTPDEYSRKEVSAQTDFLQSGNLSPELSIKDEKLQIYENRICDLEKELSDLKLFTTMEKQMFTEQNSESNVMKKFKTCSMFSPCLEKSSMPQHSINLSLADESFGVINSLVDRKSEANRNVLDLDQEMFFQNLNIVIEKLSKILNINSLLPSIVNPYFKVIYHLINMIFQKHFIGIKTAVDEQAREMLTLLTKIFIGFGNLDDSSVQTSELVIHFDELSQQLLKDLKKLLVNSESSAGTCGVNGDVPDVVNVSCSASPNANLMQSQSEYQVQFLKETIDTHLETISLLQRDYEVIKKQLAESEDKIKEQEQRMADLEKTTSNSHLETISHLQSDYEVLKKQLAESEDEIKEQEQVIASLERTTADTHLEIISRFQSDYEVLKKQLAESEDKIKEQEQVIANLEKTNVDAHLETISHLQSDNKVIQKQLSESVDKIKEQEQVIASLENKIELNVKCCTELTDNFTQTSYMTLLNQSSKEWSDETLPLSDGYGSKIKDKDYSICFKSGSSTAEENAPNLPMSVVKSELYNLKMYTQKIMENSMPKAYYDDVTINEPSEVLGVTSTGFLKTEIAALKKMLHKIKFYIKNRSEWAEDLESGMVDKMAEISSLQRKCSSAEMALNEKENLLNQLNENLGKFKKEILDRKFSSRTMSIKLKCLDIKAIKSVNDVICLMQVMETLADAIVEGDLVLEKIQRQHSLKESKITQTVENYPDLAALEEVRAHEFKERSHLYQENASLKLKIEELVGKVNDLKQGLNSKENKISEIQKAFDEEIEINHSRRRELEKSWMETMQNRIKDIEDKYEEELNTQEKHLFDMMNERLTSAREDYKSRLEKKQAEYEMMTSQLTEKCETLKSDLEKKLEDSNRKLETEIRDFKSREENARIAYYKMKDKFKEYVQGVKDMRMKTAKYCKEKETQTQETENPTARICTECKAFRLEHKELKSQTALKSAEIVSLESNNKNMIREIAALKKDLSAKSALLLTCNCRLFANPQELIRESAHKMKISNAAEIDQDQDQCRKTALDPKKILKLDIVQKAIEEAREAERAIFNNGEGPASQEMCILLRRKLAKKDKEISELRNMISHKQLKVVPVKSANSENMHPIDAEVVNNFTPAIKTENYSDKAILKVPPKKTLHEMNRPQNTEVPRNEWFMTEEEAEKAKEMEENLRKFRREPDCKQQ